VLTAVKVRPGNVAGRLTADATADLAGVCARRLIASQGRDEGTITRSNKGTDLCSGAGE
jgi:hypothetical protein